MGNGASAEMQLVPDVIADVQNAAHKEYDVFRDSTASLADVEAAKAKTEGQAVPDRRVENVRHSLTYEQLVAMSHESR